MEWHDSGYYFTRHYLPDDVGCRAFLSLERAEEVKAEQHRNGNTDWTIRAVQVITY